MTTGWIPPHKHYRNAHMSLPGGASHPCTPLINPQMVHSVARNMYRWYDPQTGCAACRTNRERGVE